MIQKKYLFIFAGAFLIAIAIALIIIFFTQDHTVTSGGFPAPVTSGSLVCESTSISYPPIGEDSSTSKSLKISAITSDNKLSSVSLIYTLNFPDSAKAESARSLGHAAMNNAFAKDNLEPDSFSAAYSVIKSSAKFSFYSTIKDLTPATRHFFLLDGITDNSYSVSAAKKVFLAKGLKCTESKS